MAGAVLALAPAASASIFELQLSTHSSDETPAADLLATFEFSVAATTLTLTVTNDTVAPNEFNMNELYFNAVDGVGLINPVLPADWSFDGSGGITVNGFGDFDFGLTNAMGETDPSQIQPGESLVFSFEITGGGDVKDFTGPGATSTLGFFIAGKFVNGPGDDSAFGATIPTPGVLALMGVAGIVAARPRRRRD
jgi:MYXO-CTERM domain-containing protein